METMLRGESSTDCLKKKNIIRGKNVISIGNNELAGELDED